MKGRHRSLKASLSITLPMTRASKTSSNKAASLASAELLAQRAERARQRASHFATCFEKHCRGEADDPSFLSLLLEAALGPDSHPALAASACLEAIARASNPWLSSSASELALSRVDPAPFLAKLSPLVAPPAEPTPLERDVGFGRAGPQPAANPWELLAKNGWAEPIARALVAAKAPWADELAPFALANGARAESVKAAAAIAGWRSSSERSKDALARALAARDAERLEAALACGAKAFGGPPPHPMAPSPLDALSGDSESHRNLASHARQRMGAHEPFPLSPFFEAGMMALTRSLEWAGLADSAKRAWAQRFWDDAFAAGRGEAPLSFEAKEALKALGAVGPSAWGTQRALINLLDELQRDSIHIKRSTEPETRCAQLIARACQMLPLFREPEPAEPAITPLCARLIEFLGSDRPARPIVERAIHKAMDQWAGSSFGPRALRWIEARSGQTHSAPNALCSLPRTKTRDFTEPASRWLGAFLSQGFDPQSKATPKSKSLAERVAASKTLAPLYAKAEALALGAVAAPASAVSKPRL